jgi:hypothetical protein
MPADKGKRVIDIGFGTETDERNNFSELDVDLWRWVDNDPDARASAAFTGAGFIATRRGQTIVYIAGLLNTFVILPITALDGFTYGLLAAAFISLWAFLLFLTIRNHKQKIALKIFRYGIIPVLMCTVLATVCRCNCDAVATSVCGAGGYQNLNHIGQECLANQSLVGAGPMAVECPAAFFTLFSCALCLLFFNMHGKYHLIGGLFGFGLDLVTDGIFNMPMGNFALGAIYLSFGVFVWVTAAVSVRNRYAAVAQAKALVQGDKAKYDRIWEEYSVKSLFSVVNFVALKAVWAKMNVTQLKTRQPTESLTSLYADAAAVNPWFQDKVHEWKCKLTERDTSTTSRWRQRLFIDIKKAPRSIEKIRRSYFGVVSQLCDVVRGSIVVETLDDAAKLLAIISSDEAVQIVRGKNRFSQHYDANVSAGYRDIQLNLQIVGVKTESDHPEPERLPLHVVEMQIHLRSIHDLKTKGESELEPDTTTGEGPVREGSWGFTTEDTEPSITTLTTGHGRYKLFRALMGN